MCWTQLQGNKSPRPQLGTNTNKLCCIADWNTNKHLKIGKECPIREMLTYSLCTGLGRDTYTCISNMQKVTAISTSFLMAQYPNNFLLSSLWVSEVKRQWREPLPLRTASSLPFFFFQKAWFAWNNLLGDPRVLTLAGKKGSRTCFRIMTRLCVTKRCGVPRTNTCTQDPGNTAPRPRNMKREVILDAHPKSKLPRNTTVAEGMQLSCLGAKR